MRYAGLHEFRSGDFETKTPVEAGGVGLGIQAHLRVAPLACLLNQCLQQQGTNALGAPRLQYGHAADVAVRQQPPGAHCRAICGNSKRVVALRIMLVPFQLQRHTLFVHEHLLANATGLGARFIPVADAYGK